MFTYLEQLIAFQPRTHEQKSVKKLLLYVQKHLQKYGFKAEILEYDGIYNLYASPTGNKHSRVLLQAHIDVVDGGEKFAVNDDKCTGRGSYDMLFAAAAYMKLIDDLKNEGASPDIAILLTGDEEIGGDHGVKAVLEDGYTTDVCILPDAGDDWGALSIAAKGIYWPTISIRGQAHHASRPWEGDGAAIKLAHFLVDVEKLFDPSDPFNSTMTVAKITAGKAQNQGPSEAEASLDIRYKDQKDFVRIMEGIEPLLKKYDGTVLAEFHGNDYQLDPDVPLIKEFVELYEKHLGRPVRQTKAHGSSDARHFSKHGISTIMLRPDGGGAHGDDEWISVSSLEKFYALLKDYVFLQSASDS